MLQVLHPPGGPGLSALRALFRIGRPGRGRRGFTLAELMIVVAILGTLAAVAVPAVISFREKAKVAAAVSDLKTMDKKLKDFFVLNGRYPATLAEVGLYHFKDPWGNPYVDLRVAGAPSSVLRRDRNMQPVNSGFDLYSMGADRKTAPGFSAAVAQDDIVRANDGGYYGLVSGY